jgi:hydroxyacylglutathione hydrolase
VHIEIVETPCLGNRSYVVIDGSTAVVVDPPRDIDRIEDVVRVHDAKVDLVLETHRHADYVSGGLELARRNRASYVVPPGEPQPMFGYAPATDGAIFGAGSIGVRTLSTPGHTPHHVSYVIEDAGRPVAVCTGGSLLHGSVGRTDLYGADQTWALARAQWQSARRLVGELPEDALLLPTHGFGSLCSAGPGSDTSSATLGEEHQVNPALLTAEEPYVTGLVDGYGPIPRHYRRLALLNAVGPTPIDLTRAPLLEPLELAARQEDGHWLVDLRDRRAFARAHLRGSVNVEATGPLVAYLPWILPPGAGVVLLGSSDTVTSAARQLAQVGIDRPLGVAVGSPQDWSGGYAGRITAYPVGTFAGFVEAENTGRAGALDVRSAPEWAAGHVAGALHLALPQLAEILDPSRPSGAVPSKAGETWVYCGGGFRAAIAASLLDAAGQRVVVIDEPYDAAAAAGLTVTESLPVPAADNAEFLSGGAIR